MKNTKPCSVHDEAYGSTDRAWNHPVVCWREQVVCAQPPVVGKPGTSVCHRVLISRMQDACWDACCPVLGGSVSV